MQSYVLRPDWIIPVDRPPLRHSAIVVNNDRIESIGDTVPEPFRHLDVIRLPNQAILPGLINSHCHLEFSDLSAPLPAMNSFAEWLRSVVQYRRNKATDSASLASLRRNAIQSGIDESYRSGVRWIVDMVTSPWESQWCSYKPIKPSTTGALPAPITIQPCFELIDVQPDRWAQTQSFATQNSYAPRSGLAPHAPYTASRDCTHWATHADVQTINADSEPESRLVSMHLAESIDEMQWLSDRTGPIHDILGPFFTDDFLRRVGTIDQHCSELSRAWRALVVHGNHLPQTALECMAAHRTSMAVVHCPRTHSHFDRAPFPWHEFKQRNIEVFIGTDSRASNPDLTLWREIQHLALRFPDNDPTELLAMITTAPARFLKIESTAGTIEHGASSRLSVIDCDHEASGSITTSQLLRTIFESDAIPLPLEQTLASEATTKHNSRL